MEPGPVATAFRSNSIRPLPGEDPELTELLARYDIPQRWYTLKARMLGLPRLADYDRMASIASEDAEFGWTEARDLVLDAYGSFSSELAGVARRLESRGLRVRTHVVVEDIPGEAILHEAEDEHAGLIALETHGRGGLSRLLHGSVADKVVRGEESLFEPNAA